VLGTEVVERREFTSLVIEPELVVGRREGEGVWFVLVFCRALARREATPSEKEGTVV